MVIKSHHNLWNAVKIVLREEFISLNVHIKKEHNVKISKYYRKFSKNIQVEITLHDAFYFFQIKCQNRNVL